MIQMYFMWHTVDLEEARIKTYLSNFPKLYLISHTFSLFPPSLFSQPIGIADFMKSMNENVLDNLHQIPRPIPVTASPAIKDVLPSLAPNHGSREGDNANREGEKDPLSGSDMDFVVIEDEPQRDRQKAINRIEVKRYREMEEKEWRAYFDANGEWVGTEKGEFEYSVHLFMKNDLIFFLRAFECW